MQIIGHELIKFKPFYMIKNLENLSQKKENIIFDFDKEFIKKSQNLNLEFSIICKNEVEILLSNSCKAKFIIVKKEFSKKAMKLANSYLFDSKIAIIIENENEILQASEDEIDCVIFNTAIKF